MQESLGFSPFELVFGQTVRGPLKLLRQKFLLQEANPLNMYLISGAWIVDDLRSDVRKDNIIPDIYHYLKCFTD